MLDNIMTESDMIISIYENQIFLEEQNREIFSYLKYGYVNEGVFEKAVDAIKSFFEKIKDLIKKFINWISSKFKSNKGSNKEKVDINSVNDTIDHYQKEIRDQVKHLNDIDFTEKVYGGDKKNKIKELENKLDNLSLKQCIIGPQAKETLVGLDGIMKSLSDNFKDSMSTIIEMTKSNETLDEDEFNKNINSFESAIKYIIESSKQVYIGQEIKMSDMKPQIKEINPIYEKYSKNIGSYIKEFNDINNKYIKESESKFNSLKLLDQGNNPQYTKCISQASQIVSLYYSYINNAIGFISKIESVFEAYKINLAKISNIQSEIDSLKKD